MPAIPTTEDCRSCGNGSKLYFDPTRGFFCEAGHIFQSIEKAQAAPEGVTAFAPPGQSPAEVETDGTIPLKPRAIPIRTAAAPTLNPPPPLPSVSLAAKDQAPVEGVVEMKNGDVFVTIRIEQHNWRDMTAAVEGGRWAPSTLEWFKKRLLELFDARAFW